MTEIIGDDVFEMELETTTIPARADEVDEVKRVLSSLLRANVTLHEREQTREVGRSRSNSREFVGASASSLRAFCKREDLTGNENEASVHSDANQSDQSIVEVWSDAPEFAEKATADQESRQQAPRSIEEQQQRQGESEQASQQELREDSPQDLEQEDYKGKNGKHYNKNKMRKLRDRSIKKAIADASMAPGSKSASTSKSASQNIESQSLVDQLARQWQELNESVPQNQDEVFNTCLSSETLLYTAAKIFKPLQLAVFTRKIRELGGEVEDCIIHYKRACDFGEKVSDELLESEIDPAGREKALENLQLLASVQQAYGTVIDTTATGVDPRQKVFQGRRIQNLIGNTNLLRAALKQSTELTLARLQSVDHQSEGTPRSTGFSHRARTPSPSISDPESDDYDPEDHLPPTTKQEKQADPSSSESCIEDLTKTRSSSQTELAKADDQLVSASLTNGEPLDELDQNTSLEAKLTREGLAYQKLSYFDVAAWDRPAEDITEQETSIEGSLADDTLVESNSYEDILDQAISVDETSAKESELKNLSDKGLTSRKDKPVKITVCLNPKTLKPRAQEVSIKDITAENPPDQGPKVQERLLEKPALAMAIAAEVSLPLPPLPTDWSGNNGKDFKAIGNVSTSTLRSVEPVGPYYLAHARRARHKRTFSEDDRIQAQESVKTVEDSDDGEISELEDPAMLLRDAKDWKGQDHYAVLGLSNHRWRATEEQIKRAHRKKVLRHHPDKKAAAGSTEDDSFFKCIQKATEILLDPVKRRQFDSVDEAADVEPPTRKQTQKGNFYKLWGPVFKAEGRFSKIQPVPKLGDENSSREDVENFYNFWYNFDSWRSFEYQDEDIPDDNENRDQKRHMERKNNNARKKKKTEDSARLRKLLDECSALDERIKKFRQEANASKNKKRLEKEAAEKKAAEEVKVKKEAEEKAAKEADEAAKAEREQGKKAKEAAKNAVKKNKRVLKSSVKDANYFVAGNSPAATIDAVLNDIELVQGKVDADEIAALAGKLTGLKVSDEIKAVWKDEVKRLVDAGKLKDGDIKTFV